MNVESPRLSLVEPVGETAEGPSATTEPKLLATGQAAARLGISVTSFYDWLGLSDRGLLMIRGQKVTIDYFQGGPRGQGRIRIEAAEIDRLHELMRVRPREAHLRRPPIKRQTFPGITVPLGRPEH